MYILLQVVSKQKETFLSGHENFIDAVAEAEKLTHIECFRICDEKQHCILGMRMANDHDPANIFWRLSRMEGHSDSRMQLRGRDERVFNKIDELLESDNMTL